jgi:hypothetical protein
VEVILLNRHWILLSSQTVFLVILSRSTQGNSLTHIHQRDYDSPPAPIIEEAARKLKEKKHHPNCIAIQFVQIGDDPNAKPTLLSLIDGPNNVRSWQVEQL